MEKKIEPAKRLTNKCQGHASKLKIYTTNWNEVFDTLLKLQKKDYRITAAPCGEMELRLHVMGLDNSIYVYRYLSRKFKAFL